MSVTFRYKPRKVKDSEGKWVSPKEPIFDAVSDGRVTLRNGDEIHVQVGKPDEGKEPHRRFVRNKRWEFPDGNTIFELYPSDWDPEQDGDLHNRMAYLEEKVRFQDDRIQALEKAFNEHFGLESSDEPESF